MPRKHQIFLYILIAAALLFLPACMSEDPASAQDAGGSAASESSGERPSGEDSGNDGTDGSAAPVEDAAVEDAAGADAVLESLYAGSGDSGDALKALERAGVDAMDGDSRLVYAVLLRNEGRLEESRKELRDLVGEEPSRADAWFNLALVEHALGDAGARDDALDRALAVDDTMAEAHALKGSLAMADSQWSRAESSLKKALDINPDSVESLVSLAWVYAKTDRIEEALPFLDKAVELEPEYTYARVDRSRINVALRNYNAAEDDLDAAISLEPDVPWHYLDRARIRLRNFKDFEGALSDLETVDRLDPGNFFAMVYLAGLHDEERRFALAKDYYLRVVEARPDYVWAYMPLGKFAWMEGDFAAAARWYGKAAAEDPDEFSFSVMTALALRRSGKATEGDRLLADVLRGYDRGETAYEVFRFCAERGSDFYAVNALNKETDETLRERLWFYMGAVYEAEGNTLGAQSVYERLAPRRGEIEYDLAWAALNGMEG